VIYSDRFESLIFDRNYLKPDPRLIDILFSAPVWDRAALYASEYHTSHAATANFIASFVPTSTPKYCLRKLRPIWLSPISLQFAFIVFLIFVVAGWGKGVVGMGLPVPVGLLGLFRIPAEPAAPLIISTLTTNGLCSYSSWA
jgi:hypothetical protein